MCGFSFYCSDQINPVSDLENSMLKIAHRGPDASGIFFNKTDDFFIGIGHNRLSILDLSDAGKQPMDLGHGVIISYNGEVYNHNILRHLLHDKGYKTKGHSDTEIVSLLYTEFGVASFAMLKGMFAFVIFDEKRKKIFLVRDRLGIKPLYLSQNASGLFASSEIRGLKAFSAVKSDVERNDIFEFFNQGFLYEPSTGYSTIKKLMPGHFLEFDLTNGMITVVDFKMTSTLSFPQSLADKIHESIRQQVVSDVSLGTFFSGGVDSSILASYAEDNDLFFAKYDSDVASDLDLKFSGKISTFLNKPLGVTDIFSAHQTADELMQTVDFVAENTEELISDYTFWATYQLSSAARAQGYKVMLSGMGGDEVFAGYPRYSVLKKHRWVKFLCPLLKLSKHLGIFPKKWDKKFERLVSYSTEKHWPTAYSRLLGYFSRRDLSQLCVDIDMLDQNYQCKLNLIAQSYLGKQNDKVKFAQFFDLSGFLSHNLMVSDKASMLASIELRVPLLDESVVAHGLSLSTNELLKNGQLKYPLKKLLATRIPKHLTDRPKTGFNPPLDGLINQIGKQRLKDEVSYAGKFINLNALDALLESHFSGTANNTYKLWQLLYFSRWLKLNDL